MQTGPKNIVICSDGTGQSYDGTESNVLRLYQLAWKRLPEQIVCYDPGVGTHPLPSGRTRLGRAYQHYVGELLLGRGVMDNVARLYRFLMEHYEPEDRIFLFGFSRGAFTVRALAGLVHVSGLLHRQDVHLIRYATGLYETSESRIKKTKPKKARCDGTPIDNAKWDNEARQFKTRLSRDCKIAFLGVWDTVKAYGWMRPQSFPALRHNPSVGAVRHAVALDEKRALFQMTGWGDQHREVKEVWFAGDHSDVGGGHPGNSALTDAALTWMLGEATHSGLLIDPTKRDIVGRIAANSRDAAGTATNSLLKGWFRVPLPRVELDNTEYPPERRPRFGAVGVRKPADHAMDVPRKLINTTSEPPEPMIELAAPCKQPDHRLLIHHSVREREQRDPAYLRARLPGGPRQLEVMPEEDREIVWDKTLAAGAE